MSHNQSDPADRVVITASDLAPVAPAPPPPRGRPVPWWGLIAGALLTLSLPLLCVFSIATRIALRRDSRRKVPWTGLLCTLLTISGLITSLAAGYFWFLKSPPQRASGQLPLGLLSHDLATSFPAFPTTAPMTSVDLASQTRLLVFIVVPGSGRALGEDNLAYAPVGAAVLLMADEHGYLLASNRHVVEPSWLGVKLRADRVLVFSSAGSPAYADVVARHKDLDLVLLAVPRQTAGAGFRQPVVRYAGIAVGSPVFVIGHPQRLFFTLSSGLVSRTGGGESFQISAPISPGNSGGPVYDSFGNLLGLVTSTIDKQNDPNAENLNFATRADAFSSSAGWIFRLDGQERLRHFNELDPIRER